MTVVATAEAVVTVVVVAEIEAAEVVVDVRLLSY